MERGSICKGHPRQPTPIHRLRFLHLPPFSIVFPRLAHRSASVSLEGLGCSVCSNMEGLRRPSVTRNVGMPRGWIIHGSTLDGRAGGWDDSGHGELD